MMKANIILITVASYSLVNLTACGHAAKFFPDKERDYQHVKEIPMLNWPKELRANFAPEPSPAPQTATIPEPPAENAAPALSATPPLTDTATPGAAPLSANASPEAAPYNIASDIPAQAKPPSDADPVPDETGDTSKPIGIEQVKRDGISRLRLSVPMLRAWRAIDKALSRNAIEVTERNPEERRFTVQYDPDEKKVQDGSLMDEVRFIFKGFQTNEKDYRLQLVETANHIEVVMVDGNKKPLADSAASVKLLDALEKTIKADFVETKK
jgi:outer membrane protein assembly factor BamC